MNTIQYSDIHHNKSGNISNEYRRENLRHNNLNKDGKNYDMMSLNYNRELATPTGGTVLLNKTPGKIFNQSPSPTRCKLVNIYIYIYYIAKTHSVYDEISDQLPKINFPICSTEDSNFKNQKKITKLRSDINKMEMEIMNMRNEKLKTELYYEKREKEFKQELLNKDEEIEILQGKLTEMEEIMNENKGTLYEREQEIQNFGINMKNIIKRQGVINEEGSNTIKENVI